MDSEWKTTTILSSEDFWKRHAHWMIEFCEMKVRPGAFEKSGDFYGINFDITRHCRLNSDPEGETFEVNIKIGEDEVPGPLEEVLFYLGLKMRLGQKMDEGDKRYLFQTIIRDHWMLEDFWREIRKFRDDGLEIIQILKSHFEDRKSRADLPDYLSHYIESQFINMKGTSESYFDSSPLLLTFQTKFGGGFPKFDPDQFAEYFQNLLSTKNLVDLIRIDCDRIENTSWDNPRYKRRIPNLSKTTMWKLNSESFAGDNQTMAFEIIYLCLIKSQSLGSLSLFENLIRVVVAR